jgi:restriction system protein
MTYASKLPWKFGVGLAFIAFVALHLIAQQFGPTSGTTDLQALGAVVLRQYVHVFATLLQFIIPAGLLFGTTASFIKHARSKELIDSVSAPSGREVSSLSWQEFERLVGEGFRQRGFQVTERGGAGPDGGVDLALARGHERFLVQCKQWRAQQVGVSVVRELYGVMAAERVAGGYVVTSGAFTKDANEFAAGRNIELVDGKELSALLRDGQSSVRPLESMPTAPVVLPKAPSCPKCRSPMVLRTAKRGAHMGRSFWGCPQYPKCQAVVARQ